VSKHREGDRLRADLALREAALKVMQSDRSTPRADLVKANTKVHHTIEAVKAAEKREQRS
jgi:hypothetical protein